MATTSTSTRKADMAGIPEIPPLRFRNDTPFDALHFDTVDQHDAGFHVIVAKTGYAFGPCGADGLAALTPLDPPAPLVHADRFYDDDIDRSVRVESDLAPYKPRCDVVVVGDAHAPAGQATAAFQVALRVQYPDRPAPVPEPPRPLNPFQPLSLEARQRWRAEVDAASRRIVPGRRVIDKVLDVTGPCELRRRSMALGVLPPWELTDPAPVLRVPVRYEYAQGGQVAVAADSEAAPKVPQASRLTDAQRQQFGDTARAPVALDACQSNPVGRGFAPAWYLDAVAPASLPAPQIARPDKPFTADLFHAAVRGKAELAPAGFGFVGRAWLPRRQRVGTFDDRPTWGPDDVPHLPPDFDFGYWNGAPDDQQCDHLTGEERFVVVNMTSADAAYARADGNGNSVLAFRLPVQALVILAASADGAVAPLPLVVDTVLIDTLAGTVELTWRVCIPADGVFTEARLLHAHTTEQLDRLKEWLDPAPAA
jgi:hypothetical protein